MINLSNIDHGFYAIVIQLIFYLIFGSMFVGAAIAVAFFLGREHAQHEYRVTEGPPIGDIPPWVGFQFHKWTTDSKMDVIVPMIFTGILSLIWSVI